MKAKLSILAALVFLSSINGIFFNNPIDISAQEYEKVDNYNMAGNNEMVGDNYSYDAYGMNQENSEYSSYNNSYEPTYSGGNEETEYSSYDNYGYSDKSYGGDNYYPPKEPKKFTCPDSGIVVDKVENCPLICPAGTDLEGHLVAAGSNLQVVCDEDAQFETCPAGTDLEGVLVENAPEDCNIFLICPPNTPLAGAEVTDLRLCNIDTDVTIVNNTEAQCLKCVDLALLAAPPGQIRPLLFALIGNDTNTATDGIFDICGTDDPRPAFNATVTATLSPPAEEDVIEVFNECVENAPGSELSAFSVLSTLQETSLTTNVRPESEISSFSSPPTVGQGTGDLTALEKMAKLKAQWIDLLP